MNDDDWDSQAAAANNSYRAGFDDALGLHAGVVAAAQRIVDLHMGVDAGDRDIAASIVSLASALNNLTSSLPWRNWIKQNNT